MTIFSLAERVRLTPQRAIRAHCLDCVGSASEVKDCMGDKLWDQNAGLRTYKPCLFYPYRMGRGRPSVKLIRKFCLYCMGGDRRLVRDCQSKACPLLPYRLGKNPARGLSEERRQKQTVILGEAVRGRRLRVAKSSPETGISHPESTIFQDLTGNVVQELTERFRSSRPVSANSDWLTRASSRLKTIKDHQRL